jgi:ubiquinone/menaquinone biosynthesis C-methylase UbiE
VPTVSARYDAVADFYVLGQPDSFDTDCDRALFDLIGPLDGARVVDIACGQGRITRELARRGAQVVGVDLSSALVDRARHQEHDDRLGIAYVNRDAASTDLLAGESFDVAVSNFGLSDIDDLDGALATVQRLLRPGGRFVFMILHPCFPGRGPAVAPAWAPGDGYYREGWWATDAAHSTLRQKVGANHRMLSTYLNGLVRHGLMIETLAEPEPPDEWSASAPGLDAVPTFLVVRARAVLGPGLAVAG